MWDTQNIIYNKSTTIYTQKINEIQKMDRLFNMLRRVGMDFNRPGGNMSQTNKKDVCQLNGVSIDTHN